MINAESLETVYTIGFNKINLCKRRRETMLFRRI